MFLFPSLYFFCLYNFVYPTFFSDISNGLITNVTNYILLIRKELNDDVLMNLKKVIKSIFLVIIILLVVSVGLVAYTYFTGHTSQTIATTDIGYVTKEVDNIYESNMTMVIITGIHPRETLAIEPEVDAARMFALTHNVNMIIYNVTVTKDAADYKNSRANGEKLVAEHILPDINRTDARVVIISHSHIEGYGEGFYVATPEMDEPSVHLAESIRDGGIGFNYYPRTGNEEYKSTSAILVSKPLAQSGYPTLVYEIPENITTMDSTMRTNNLLTKCYEILKG